jgi:preprotein translocase subunit Sss1
MKALLLVGVVVLVLGIVSFFVPVPHSEHHGVSLGDAHIGVTTEHDEKVAPAISMVLVVAGAGLMLAGRKA